MAFVRKRRTTTRKGKDYFSHQLIETYRENGKMKQRVLANFGPWATAGGALEGWQRHLVWKERLLRESETHLAKAAEYVRKIREDPDQFDLILEQYRRRSPEERPVSHEYPIHQFPPDEPDHMNRDYMRDNNICYRVLAREVPKERRKVEKIRKNVEAIRRHHNYA